VDVKVLLVAPYPPARDGIAAYAGQVAADLRRRGDQVEVVSPEPSAAQHHADYRHLGGMLRLLRLSRRSDRTLIHFYPDLFFRSLRRVRFVLHWPSVAAALALGRNVELVVHEAPYRDLRRARGVRGLVARALWRGILTLPRATYVHTEWERREIVSSLGLAPDRVRLLDHGQAFTKRAVLGHAEARRELGLAQDDLCFLCIGFLQHHKGFDRAVRAFARIPGRHLRLDVVGSARVPAPEIESYVGELRALVGDTPRAALHEGYVSDHAFDTWLAACDVVVLPYREIWSSGVVARAHLFGRRVIVTDVGGLPDQAGALGTVVRDDEELYRAMAAAAGARVERAAAAPARLEPVAAAAADLNGNGRQPAPGEEPIRQRRAHRRPAVPIPARRRRRSQGLT
jgi:glycosyltransferase involved in cell wall biosynthesis